MESQLPIIKRREIEARVIRPIFEEMVTQFGKEAALSILKNAIRRDAVTQGATAASTDPKENDIAAFVKLYELWTADEALEMDVLKITETSFDFNITDCQYARMYKKLDIPELGSVLSCGRDKHFCGGFNPQLQLQRSQTIMKGAKFCDFRYRLEKNGQK
ncbi:MAG: 2-amino-thiazoline-4-carboxylic acid hydrolase [Rhodospirillaceae bacterium]|nr:2-amino-thiazoline-4-carboxylic acid hydrolase [Rhodospirillaceae bacterium]|tara:strand:- start:432 stop:911 length:480 start_codon:yes stop_codon:yes gene_type:complete